MYCTLADLIEQIREVDIIELTDDEDLSPSSIDPNIHTAIMSRINWAIEIATSEIDSYLTKKYATPLSPIDSLITSICASLSIYYLFTRRNLDIPFSRLESRKFNIEKLKEIADGIVEINGIESLKKNSTIEINSSDRIFSLTSLNGF